MVVLFIPCCYSVRWEVQSSLPRWGELRDFLSQGLTAMSGKADIDSSLSESSLSSVQPAPLSCGAFHVEQNAEEQRSQVRAELPSLKPRGEESPASPSSRWPGTAPWKPSLSPCKDRKRTGRGHLFRSLKYSTVFPGS